MLSWFLKDVPKRAFIIIKCESSDINESKSSTEGSWESFYQVGKICVNDLQCKFLFLNWRGYRQFKENDELIVQIKGKSWQGSMKKFTGHV